MTQANAKIDGIQKSKFSTSEPITPYKDVTNYNNYYEFSTDKYGPAGLAKDFRTRPWTVSIEGLVKKTTKSSMWIRSLNSPHPKSVFIDIDAWKGGRS